MKKKNYSNIKLLMYVIFGLFSQNTKNVAMRWTTVILNKYETVSEMPEAVQCVLTY